MRSTNRLAGFIRRPGPDEIARIAATEHMHLDAAECEALARIIDRSLESFDGLDEIRLPEDFLRVSAAGNRDQGHPPSREEDPFNAFIRKCHVEGSGAGLLAGKRIGLKDCIRVAGIPTTNGSRLVGSFIPRFDAAVVERILNAGGTIVGKLNMDDFAFAGTGETSVFGPPRNPVNPRHSAGGSSGGSGAAVAAGDVDIALGVDEAGSARIPAAWCGVTSIKPTHGLVPTFGISYMDHSLDFVCPIAKDIVDVAKTLQVIAGPDDRDPQWVRGDVQVDDYLTDIDRGVDGLTVGVVRESLGIEGSEADVDDATLALAEDLRKAGANVTEVSVPLWPHAPAIWNGFASHSITQMIESDLEGFSRKGVCDVDWQMAFGMARRSGAFDPSPQLKVLLIVGRYLMDEYHNTYFSKATNLRYLLTRQIDALFESVDVLVTPTCPMKAIELMDKPINLENFAFRSASMTSNCIPANITGHPAATVPSGTGDNDLPIGFQIMGPTFRDQLVLQVAKVAQDLRRS